jgi:myo-inositol-1-phosphate synthase
MDSRQVRVGIVGVGNCASSFIQGLTHYREVSENLPPPGLMNVEMGGYRVADVEIASAFDVDASKVGRDVSDAIFAGANNTFRFAEPMETGVIVQRGPTMDGIGRYLADRVYESAEKPIDIAAHLQETGTNVVVSYLPVGSQRATEYYAEQALNAGCAFVNCIPVFIASNPVWAERFRERGLPLVGDDIKSQVGATIVHRVLAALMQERGVRLDRTYQLNFGGNTDFCNMLERERLESKKISKTQAVTSQIGTPLPADDVHIGPSDFVPWLADRKWAHIRLEGTAFGGVPLNMELKLEVWDSPNSAGIVIDAVRCAKLALDRGIGGPLIGPSSYFMKSPPQQFSDHDARIATLQFVNQNGKAGNGSLKRMRERLA